MEESNSRKKKQKLNEQFELLQKRSDQFELLQKRSEQFEIYNKVLEQNTKRLKDKIQSLEKELTNKNGLINIYEGTSKFITGGKYSLNDLITYEKKLEQGIKEISKAKNGLIDKHQCVICLDKQSNVVYMDGCAHSNICNECEEKIQTRIRKCPICKAPYTKVKLLVIK